jgi:hypothetical protein
MSDSRPCVERFQGRTLRQKQKDLVEVHINISANENGWVNHEERSSSKTHSRAALNSPARLQSHRLFLRKGSTS